MAKLRLATFSVADHIDLRHLIPDVLSFDKLVFPYPRDDDEWQRWESRGWRPDLLAARLTQLGDLAHIYFWGKDEDDSFSTHLATARTKYAGAIPFGIATKGKDAIHWEIAQQGTRISLEMMAKWQFGEEYWLLPRYGSLAAIQAERSFKVPAADLDSRRERLSVLVGHELELPADENPVEAYEKAIALAGRASFQKARRDLNTQQELTVMQEQTGRQDAQAIADLVSDFNAQVRTETKSTRKQWMFTVIKGLKKGVEFVEKPFSTTLDVALEVAETAADDHDIPSGPIAVFHHVHRHVFDRSR
jgi:hypothetical protein